MNISIIVAVGQNNEIGYTNKLLWRLRADLQRFKNLTYGHCVLMGKNTYESISKPLPGRTNIVVSSTLTPAHEQVHIFQTIDDALKYALSVGERELFVIGGAQIYKYFLPLCHKIYLTKVQYSGKADTYFPVLNMNEWQIIHSEIHKKDTDNEYDTEFVEMHRKHK
ncbi:MAG: dihydrofolate reductase [Cytophagales bacterium]|nr:dihydrofolate reductase [Cytophagales bacterium]